MQIECPACARSYHVKRVDIGENGRRVICQQCNTSWVVRGEPRRAMEARADATADVFATATAFHAPAVTAQFSVTTDAPKFRPTRQRRGRPILTFVACMGLSMAFIGAREPIVRTVPRLAGVYEAMGLPVNLRGLEFANVSPQRVAANDVTVSGTIRNVVRHKVSVPALLYEIRGADGAPLATWTEKAPVTSLSTGKSLPFASKPHPLPPAAKTVLVRFIGDEDAVANRQIARPAP